MYFKGPAKVLCIYVHTFVLDEWCETLTYIRAGGSTTGATSLTDLATGLSLLMAISEAG